MPTDTDTQEATAFVRYFRKSTPVNADKYDVHEASISIPLPCPNGADQDFLSRAAQVLADMKVEVWTALGIEYEIVDGNLVDKVVTPTPRPVAQPSGNGSGGGSAPTQQTAQGGKAPDQACGVCGGNTFNNTGPGDKKNPKSPDYKCKNRDCGSAMWLTGNGAGQWK